MRSLEKKNLNEIKVKLSNGRSLYSSAAAVECVYESERLQFVHEDKVQLVQSSYIFIQLM